MARKQARFGQPAVYNSSGPSLSDGDDSALNVDSSGILKTALAYSGASSSSVQGAAADNAAAVGNPLLSGGKYNATAPTYDDGDVAITQADVNGNTKVTSAGLGAGEDLSTGVNVQGVQLKPVASATYSPTVYKDAGTVTKANIKASAGNVYSIRLTNTNAAVRYFQLHNKATAPAAGETAQGYWVVPAGTTTVPAVLELDMTYFAPSEYFATGIGWAVSTTATTFTDSATAGDHLTHVRYI